MMQDFSDFFCLFWNKSFRYDTCFVIMYSYRPVNMNQINASKNLGVPFSLTICESFHVILSFLAQLQKSRFY